MYGEKFKLKEYLEGLVTITLIISALFMGLTAISFIVYLIIKAFN